MIMMKISKLIIVQKRLLYALPCVLALLAVWGVASVVSQNGEEGDGSAVSDTCMTVAVTPTMDCLPVYVAVETGIAAEMGCDLALQEHTSIADCDTALVGGSAFCASTTVSGQKCFWLE